MASERAQILITAIDQTRQAFASVKGNLEGLSGVASKLNGLLTGLGAALSLGALVAAGRHALDTADQLDELTQKTGISVEALAVASAGIDVGQPLGVTRIGQPFRPRQHRVQ